MTGFASEQQLSSFRPSCNDLLLFPFRRIWYCSSFSKAQCSTKERRKQNKDSWEYVMMPSFVEFTFLVVVIHLIILVIQVGCNYV